MINQLFRGCACGRTHQAAPRVLEQGGRHEAEGGGEDGEVRVGQLFKVGPAAGLRHQRVAVEPHGEIPNNENRSRADVLKTNPFFVFYQTHL